VDGRIRGAGRGGRDHDRGDRAPNAQPGEPPRPAGAGESGGGEGAGDRAEDLLCAGKGVGRGQTREDGRTRPKTQVSLVFLIILLVSLGAVAHPREAGLGQLPFQVLIRFPFLFLDFRREDDGDDMNDSNGGAGGESNDGGGTLVV
jgi:hypothetical protein